MKIEVKDFCNWLDGISSMCFADKCFFKYLVNEYGKKNSVEERADEKACKGWEEWLNSNIRYDKNDLSKGLPAVVYNTLLRSQTYDYETMKYISLGIKTNRDLEKTSDYDLEKIRNMSPNKVKKVREYLELNRQRILQENING